MTECHEQPELRTLAEWLRDLGVTPGELAERMGASRPHVSRWLHHHHAPRLITQHRIAKALGVAAASIRWPLPQRLVGWPPGKKRGPRPVKQQHTPPPQD